MAESISARAYSSLLKLLPPAVAGRVLPGLARQFREVGVTRVDDAPIRVLIGPVNSAGQALAWARSAETLSGVNGASCVFRGDDDTFGFKADHVIPASALVGNHRWRVAQRAAILTGFTHVLMESGRHLYELDGDPLALIHTLQNAEVRVALIWHGSDIRSPRAHAAREADSPFGHGYPDTEVLERIAANNHDLAVRADVPMFVSTPDLLSDVPEAQWLPVVVDPRVWAAPPRRPRARPVVVHAPSRAAMKGTAQIAEAMTRLHHEGVIEYREVRGVAASAMPALYADADIVLDQFLLGSYGVAACEALAVGRVVVGHVSDDVRQSVRARTGLRLPIVESRVHQLEAVLRELVGDQPRMEEIAVQGPDFVAAVHDGTLAASVLDTFLGSSHR